MGLTTVFRSEVKSWLEAMRLAFDAGGGSGEYLRGVHDALNAIAAAAEVDPIGRAQETEPWRAADSMPAARRVVRY
jgi:hypothetical protein